MHELRPIATNLFVAWYVLLVYCCFSLRAAKTTERIDVLFEVETLQWRPNQGK